MLENGEIIMGEGYFDRKIYNANSKRLNSYIKSATSKQKPSNTSSESSVI